MTQWYKAVNIDKNEYLWPLSFNSGDNLMESCYVGNDFVNAMTALLSGPWHGDQVMYIGDYAWDDVVLGDCSCSGAALLRGLKENSVLDADPYAAAMSWHDAAEYCAVPETIGYVLRGGHGVSEVWEPVAVPAHEGEIDCEEKRYVVNETQGVFYDRDKLKKWQCCHLTQDPPAHFPRRRQRSRRRRLPQRCGYQARRFLGLPDGLGEQRAPGRPEGDRQPLRPERLTLSEALAHCQGFSFLNLRFI